MSWKSLVSAGLLCVLASPAFAVPTLSLVKGGTESSGHLNASGQWVWKVQITPTGTGSPLAAELGFRETGDADVGLVSATKNAADWDTDNPGTVIFGWETLTDVDPSPTVTNLKPVGVQTNTTTDEVFSAIGSIDFATAGAKDYITIVLDAPEATSAAPNSVTTVQWLGKYGAGSVNGRIAELVGSVATNFDTFAGTATRTARGGDTNLDGTVSIADFATLQNNYNQSGKFWHHGDYNRDGTVSIADFSVLQNQYNSTYTVGPGAGAGAVVTGVPEPASLALLALAALGVAGLRFRR